MISEKMEGVLGRLGAQNFLYNTFSYGRRFPIAGNWFWRAGFKLERYDFGGFSVATPSKLQSVAGSFGIEYVQQGFVGAAVEIYPGAYFENDINVDTLDMPWDLFSAFTIKEKKLYGVLGASGASNYHYPVIPIFGVIWITSEKTRAELIFPKASLIYSPNESWEWRVTGEFTGGGYRTGTNEDPRLNQAVLQYSDSRLGGYATYSGFKPLQISVGGGYVFRREFDCFRVDRTYTVEGTPFFRVTLGLLGEVVGGLPGELPQS